MNADDSNDVIILTDVRFPNEIEELHNYVTDCRIVPIRIERDLPLNELKHQHVSETALDDYKFFEYIVDNNDSLERLHESSLAIVEDMYKDI